MVRKNMNLIGEEGPFQMTIEYMKPDRMRQTVKTLAQPEKTSETILIGNEAWGKGPEGWSKFEQGTTEQIKTFFNSTLNDLAKNVGIFECMGAETIDGKKLRSYRGKDEVKPETPEQKEAKKQAGGGEEPKNEAVRVVYIDIETGLPSHIIFAREGMLDKPIFKEVYTYPTDLKIDRPTEIKP
ncbi:MAG: hypothetical protein ACKOW3_01720 [Hyphomicrobium sp.]